MANLIILKEGNTKILNEEEVHPEERIEKLIFEHERILPDVFLLKRQLVTYSRTERIDLVGVDNENNILVIEIKDETADESVIPQVMRYALWVETHPDAIKSLWLEQKEIPEDFIFDWDKEFLVKIMIIAPSFKPSVQKLINRITYPVELIEFKKFKDGETDYVFLNKVLIDTEKSHKPVSSIREYDLKFYKKQYNPNSAEEFWKLANKIERFVNKKGWNLTRNNNQWYVSFKYGFPIVFGVTFIGSKSFGIFFKIPETISRKIKIKGYTPHKVERREVLYKVNTSKIDLKVFEPLFEASYAYITGSR